MSAKTAIKQFFTESGGRIFGRTTKKDNTSKAQDLLNQDLAFRISLETIMTLDTIGKSPYQVFWGITDQFWFWLNSKGIRMNSALSKFLPGLADESTQEMYTGKTGDRTLWEGFYYYRLFKNQYEKYRGNLTATKILDFGCGWGRIIRFFTKDIPATNLWGCDPVEEMIQLCKSQNKWANFEHINSNPPTSFEDNSFDLIYSFSVFSHLSEEFHLSILPEISRILKPGGIYMTTTRNRNFIGECSAITNPQIMRSDYDKGSYCHHNYDDSKWSYWGESMIPRKYVLDHWTKHFNFLDFIEDNFQNIIVVQKPMQSIF
jgi:ubiquinone/menaquinone biosynthesis C-methylase UbiE